MTFGKFIRYGLVLLLLIALCGCVAGQKHYKLGMRLSEAGKKEEALTYLTHAVKKEPNNKKFQQALDELKNELIIRYTEQGTTVLHSQNPSTIVSITQAEEMLHKAEELDATHAACNALKNAVEKEKQALSFRMDPLYAAIKSAMEAEDWLTVFSNLQEINKNYPGYRDSAQLINTAKEKGTPVIFQQAKDQFDAQEYSQAKTILTTLLAIDPSDKDAKKLLALATERDTKAYFTQQGNNAANNNAWAEAITSYKRALTYDPDDQSLVQALNSAQTKACPYYTQQAKKMLENDLPLMALQQYTLAKTYTTNKNNGQLNALLQEITFKTRYTAQQCEEKGHLGAAWYIYSQIQKATPDYQDTFYLTQKIADRIKERVQKSIAVFDFGSPSDNADAGIIVANNLITYLFKNASGDIKILERENIKSILEEMQLEQSGLVSQANAREIGKVYGIDVAIMGNVLLFKVESDVSNGVKSVRYQIGETIEDNIEYLNWKARNPNPTKAQLASAPPAKIKSPKFAEKDYAVSDHKKVGFIQLSFRIVDIRTGENIQAHTLERKKKVKDTTSAGLPEANIKFDPLEIPTDLELLHQMTKDIVAELGQEALKPLQNLEETYLAEGENFIQRREKLKAVERFVDALFVEKLKGNTSSTTQKAHQHLENIFSNFRLGMLK